MTQEESYLSETFYAIPLSNTVHREWVHKEDKSVLIFSWPQGDFTGREKKGDLVIAVTKAYPNYSAGQIKELCSGIKLYSKLKAGDGIVGLNDQNSVEKIGFISSVEQGFQNKQIAININWDSTLIANESIIKPTQVGKKIELVYSKSLTKPQILLTKGISYTNIRSREFSGKFEFPQMDSMISANESIVYVNDLEQKLERTTKIQGGVVELFYGTNRVDTGSLVLKNKYGNTRGELKLGFCSVSIPKNHQQGEIERPIGFWGFELFPESESKHIVVKQIEPCNETDFLKRINHNLESDEDKSALIFIHGYNNSFVEAARHAAQIKYDIPFNGIAGFFSWPSAAGTLAYLKDIENADSSISAFQHFLEVLITKTAISKLHLIAHSMGNRLMTATLNNISDKAALKSQLHIFNQIVLAAPDLDQGVFREQILPKFKHIGQQRTLYASANDRALGLSQQLRSGLPRLGDGGKDIFVHQDISTIDATDIPAEGNKHSYIFEINQLLTDLYLLFDNGFPPLKRRLVAKAKDKLRYWVFPS